MPLRARLGPERNVELGRRSRRAIDLLGGRRRQRQPRALTGHNIDVEAVAAGDAARRVDEHAGQAVVLGRGKPYAERAGFMQDAAAGDTILQPHVELHRAPRPVVSESR